MHKTSHFLTDFMRLFLLFILLPLFFLGIGPLLVVAAVLGSLSIFGRLQLAPSKHYRGGRVWAFLVGILLWAFTWMGGAWLWNTYSPMLPLNTNMALFENAPAIFPPVTSTTGAIVFYTTTPTITPLKIMPTDLPSATPTNVVVILVSATISSTETSLAPPLPPTSTPSPTQIATTILTPPPTEISTSVPTISPTPTTPPAPTLPPTATALPPTVEPTQQALAIQSVNEANNVLIQAIQNVQTDSPTPLEPLWQGSSLGRVQAFIQSLTEKYQYPLKASYEIIGVPIIFINPDTTLSIQSRERWVFEDANGTTQSLGQYYYTLQKQNEQWIIVSYQFERLSTVAP